MTGRCCALVLLATFASPRRGEATALRRYDLDLDAHFRMRPAYAERSTGETLLGPPKSKPGRHIAGMPDAIIAALRRVRKRAQLLQLILGEHLL